MLINYPSHRAYDRLIQTLGRKPQQYFTFKNGKHYLDITEDEFNLLKANMPGYCVNTIRKARPKGDLFKTWEG
jgi:hypothetical protein